MRGWRGSVGCCMAAGAAVGVALIYLGTSHRMDKWLYAHIALCSVRRGVAGSGVDEGTRMAGSQRTFSRLLRLARWLWLRRELRQVLGGCGPLRGTTRIA